MASAVASDVIYSRESMVDGRWSMERLGGETDMKEQLAAFGIGKERKKPPFSHLKFAAIINTEHYSAGLAGLRPDFRPAMTDLVLATGSRRPHRRLRRVEDPISWTPKPRDAD
ncbi:hypothetical protein LTR41_005176 [Exophiala xenobiotica]|nr:hypothetical protein LTR41_005176 [Exophiala xenobiotica]KAK5324860.1 hypothetical protein LTR93_004335 [Exophiala xenobiotica]KAK5352572.1 hypothetical protein LTR61_003698 [Exophiala xenobiotica]KAK5375435.1 hypothetical protein LTR11_004985 [Exophiala xenobiotica]